MMPSRYRPTPRSVMHRRDRINKHSWRCAQQHHYPQLTAAERACLLDTQSLTQRLMTASDGHLRIHIVRQQWQRPQRSEAQALGIKQRHYVRIREVLLCCHQQPWVFARSVLPARTLTGSLAYLRHLDNRSLGSLLFRHPLLQRTAFELAQIDGDSDTLPQQVHQPCHLWARRCCFSLAQRSILVSEFFLPPCMNYLKKEERL